MEKDLEKAGGKDNFMNRVFDQTIETKIGKAFAGNISCNWIKVENKEVWLIKVKPTVEPVYCNNGEQFYIRREASTVELKGRELVSYLNDRFRDEY
jgi:predicted HTH transcriptional regulator